jgi:hypothetical protein
MMEEPFFVEFNQRVFSESAGNVIGIRKTSDPFGKSMSIGTRDACTCCGSAHRERSQ